MCWLSEYILKDRVLSMQRIRTDIALSTESKPRKLWNTLGCSLCNLSPLSSISGPVVKLITSRICNTYTKKILQVQGVFYFPLLNRGKRLNLSCQQTEIPASCIRDEIVHRMSQAMEWKYNVLQIISKDSSLDL